MGGKIEHTQIVVSVIPLFFSAPAEEERVADKGCCTFVSAKRKKQLRSHFGKLNCQCFSPTKLVNKKKKRQILILM